MISPASQRAIDRTWRWVAPTSRISPSSRPRRSAIIASVLSTAIDVKPKIIATKIGPRQRAQAPCDVPGPIGLEEDRPEQRARPVARGQLGREQRVAERQIARVD